jgi:hypothetical protein
LSSSTQPRSTSPALDTFKEVCSSPAPPESYFPDRPVPCFSPLPYHSAYVPPVQPQPLYNPASHQYHPITTHTYASAYMQHERTPYQDARSNPGDGIHSQILMPSAYQLSGPFNASTVYRQPSPRAPVNESQRSLRARLFQSLRKSPSRNHDSQAS